MPISNKIIDTGILQDKSIQINYENGTYHGIGDIANLYTTFDYSELNESEIDKYPGIIYGNGQLDFNYFGIRDLGYNGNTYDHEWHVFIVDSAKTHGFEELVIPSNNSHGYTYLDGAGNNQSTYDSIYSYIGGRRIWRLSGPVGYSTYGGWSPCSSGLETYGGLVGWTNGVRLDNECVPTDSDGYEIFPSDSSTDTTWKFPNFPFTDHIDRDWTDSSTVMDAVQQELEPFSDDLYSICVDTDNDGIVDHCRGGYSGRQNDGSGSECISNTDCYEGSYYIGVLMQSNDAEWVNETRDKTITIYKLPKKHILDLWLRHDGTTETITWKSGGTYARPDRVENERGERGAAAFSGGDLSITLTAPSYLSNNDLPPPEYTDWYNVLDQVDYINYLPTNKIDYVGLKNGENNPYGINDLFDFRPISYVGVNYNDDITDIQSWYELDSMENLITSAPNQINLSFRIAHNNSNPNIDYYNYDYESNQWENHLGNDIGDVDFSFFVIDWDSTDEDTGSDDEYWNNIISNLPVNLGELNIKNSLHGTHEYSDLIDFENNGYKSITHGYQSAGVKIIKALVFSYIKHPSEGITDDNDNLFSNYRQSLRWKIVTIKVFLGASASNIEDFSDIGGSDFTYIPWPRTTPIIGGVSENSKYHDSVYDIYNSNFFNDNELYDYYRTFTAFNNLPNKSKNELGDHLGDIDISQIRYFTNGIYDMKELLNLSDDEINPDNNTLNPYNDYDYWVGDQCVHYNTCNDEQLPTYPLNSSIGMIFINDNDTKNLRDDCLLEFNMSEEEDNLIDDTSGNDHKGILMGDYSVKKDDYGKPVSRDMSIDIPEIDRDEGAF